MFEEELVKSLALADAVAIASVFRPEAIPEGQRLETSALIKGLKKAGRPASEFADADAIVQKVAPQLRAGEVVVILSNGGFGGIYEKLPQRLKSLHEVASKA